jgi:ABC-type multidrug transport system fused ATPase/permease subunit
LKRILKDIFNILNAGEKRKLWVLSVSDVILSVLDIGFLVLLLYVINFYTRPASALPSGFFSLPIIHDHPLLLIVVFFLLFTLKNVFGFIISGSQYHFVYGVASRLSRDGLMLYLDGNYTDYIHIDSSVINRKISQQPVEFCHYVLNGMQQVFSQVVLIMITSIAVIIFNPLLFPLLILFLVPPVFFISFLMKRKLNDTLHHGKYASEKAIQHLQEALSGYVESNIYLKNDFFTNRYYRFQAQLNRYLSARLTIQNMPGRLIEVFAVFGLLILIVANSFATHDRGIRLVTIGALMIAVYKIIPGIVKITNTTNQIRSYAYSTAGLSNTIGQNPDRMDQQIPVESVKFERISFRYEGKPILSDFSLNMFKAELIGIAGISGRGKTTLINILLGFLPADSGNIYINSRIADPENRKHYWSRIAYCKQQHFFLHDSIIKNITLTEGDYDRGKLDKVLAITGIDKLISVFPRGLDTIITENGKNFSGGQRQRFIFARALYKDADLLILDEPFNELDDLAEKEMLQQLQNIAAQGRIVLLITHNKDALNYCNKKCLMDE